VILENFSAPLAMATAAVAVGLFLLAALALRRSVRK
jgi:hypothetical protein